MIRKTPIQKLNRGPAIVPLLAVGASAGASIISSRNEKKAAQAAANAQENINAQNIKAAEDAEKQAQATARAQQKAAVARRQRTILTTPLGANTDPGQVNQPTILGVQ